MNFFEDENVVREIKKAGRKKILIAGLWTEICVALPALDAIEAGYEVYVVADACGDVSSVAHDMSMHRMIQAGAVTVTWLQVLLELQRDWARMEIYGEVLNIAKEHAGAYGVGIQYAEAVLKK
jgi:nicotinamidase-related amidase